MKTPKIRWKPEEKREFARMRRYINKKITSDKWQSDYISRKVKFREIYSRRDFEEVRRLYRDMKNSRKIVEYKGLQIYEFQKKEIERNLRKINNAREKKRKSIDYTSGNMGLVSDYDYMPITFDHAKSKDDIKRILRNINLNKYDSKEHFLNENYKKNYLMVINNLGANKKKVMEIKKAIQKMSGEELYDMAKSDHIMHIDFIYDPVGIEEKINAIHRIIFSKNEDISM